MIDKKFESLNIENVVASGAIADSIDLDIVANTLENCKLNKRRFPGAVYRIEKPKGVALIFSSGKIVLTGFRNPEALTDGLARVTKSLKTAGIETLKEPKVTITNMVCSYNLGRTINLNKMVIALNVENVEYEPEQFPGLVYRVRDPNIVVLLFSSGKIILTGGKNLEEIKKGVDILEQKLKSIM